MFGLHLLRLALTLCLVIASDQGARDDATDSPDHGDTFLYDKDEFIGVHTQVVSESSPVIRFGATGDQDYTGEICGVVFIMIYGINFLYGRRSNEEIAISWYRSVDSLFETQFAALGIYAENQVGVQGKLLKDSHSCYKFYASGRRHCLGMLCTVELVKRHDLVSLFMSVFDLSTTHDTVTIEVPMDDQHMEPFIFAIVKKRKVTRTLRDNRDLTNYADQSACSLDGMRILSDSASLESEFVDPRVARLITTDSDFELLHFTDQSDQAVLGSSKILRFRFALPPADQMQRLHGLTKMAMHYIDRVAQLRLSAATRAKATKRRHAVRNRLYREAMLQRKEQEQWEDSSAPPRKKKPKDKNKHRAKHVR